MKTIHHILLFVLFLLNRPVAAQNNILFTEQILYAVCFDSPKNNQNPYYNHLETFQSKKIIDLLCNGIRSGRLPAYNCCGDEVSSIPGGYAALDPDDVRMYFQWHDSMTYEQDNKKYVFFNDTLRNNQLYRNLINRFSFMERWNFDPVKNVFLKKVAGVVLMQDKYTHNIGMRCHYSTLFNDSTGNCYESQNFIGRIIYDVPITRPDDRQYDETNWWYNYIEASKRSRMLRFLEFKAMDDTVAAIKVYSGEFPFDSLIERKQYVNSGLGMLFYGRSIVNAGDPLMFGLTDEKIQASYFELADWTTIKKLRFDEEWYFDPLLNHFEKKVLGLGLIVDTYNDNGTKTGERCLVYYKLGQL